MAPQLSTFTQHTSERENIQFFEREGQGLALLLP